MNDYKWRPHIDTDPFFNYHGPVEVILKDGTFRRFEKPWKLRGWSPHVSQWRCVSGLPGVGLRRAPAIIPWTTVALWLGSGVLLFCLFWLMKWF